MAHAQPGLDLHPVFSTLGHPVSISACPRPGPILHPCLLVYRPYVSVSSPLQWGISFLGHPTPPRLTAWSPAPALPERALDGFPRSVHPFFVALGRYYTPCPTYRMETIYGCTKWPNGDKSLLGLPDSRLAGLYSRCLRTFVENPVHSHLLGASPLSASSLSPLSPLHSDV